MRTAVAALRRLLPRPPRERPTHSELPELPGPAAALLLHLLEAVMPPSMLTEAAAAAHAPSVHAQTPAGSTDGSSGSQAATLQRPKSAKRRASEAALERRFSSSDLVAAAAAAGGDPSAKRLREERPAVRVAACSDCCSGRAETDSEEADNAAAWCAQDVALPPMDWAAALQSVQHDGDMAYDRVAGCYQLPGGISVYVVTCASQLVGALGALRASMQDSCIAIDLEWKPEGWAGAERSTRVALMQLASATTAVLVRVCHLKYRMPQQLRDFLSDPELTFVGFSWDGADELKMQATFGTGRKLFSRFLDLQQIGQQLGYHGLGLGALTKQVLGFQPPKDRKVTMSNWEARQLSAKQMQYAALDAIITGHIYRGLRLWHASPSACTSCRQMLGAELPRPEWRCMDCQRSFQSAPAAWETTVGSGSVGVCMIDTGARRTHQDLAANIVGGWNTAVTCKSYDPPTGCTRPAVGSAQYYNFGDATGAGHGTHTAGSVGAVGNNSVGITGVAQKVALHICKASQLGAFWEESLIDCIQLCRSQPGVRVISASVGSGGASQAMNDAIASACKSGVLFVASAGNAGKDSDRYPMFPASYELDCIVSVAATRPDDSLAPFSNYGASSVHLAAPGVNIRSTVNGGDDAYAWLSGTSMSTPLVSGALALLFAAKPRATAAEARAALLSSVDQVPALRGKLITGGRLNVARAMATLLGQPPPYLPPTQYRNVVEQDTFYELQPGDGSERYSVTNATADACLASCRRSSWCYFVLSLERLGMYRTVRNVWSTDVGNCIQMDAAGLVLSTQKLIDSVSGYKLPLATAPAPRPPLPPATSPSPPPPSPSPPSGPAAGTWANPINIAGVPFLSPERNTFFSGTLPSDCVLPANTRMIVYKWKPNSASKGNLTVSSCGMSVGDTRVAVLSSPNPALGAKATWTCSFGDDNFQVCGPSDAGFNLGVPIQQGHTYYIAVAPYNPLLKPFFRLSVTTSGIKPIALPSPPPSPMAPLLPPSPSPSPQPTGPPVGTLQNPIDIDAFPYLGPRVSAFNRDSVPAAAVDCGFQDNRPFVAYRWRSEVSHVAATASSCGHALGDTVVAVLRTASPASGQWECVTYNDDGCFDGTRSFSATAPLEEGVFYYFLVAPFDPEDTSVTLRLNVTVPGLLPGQTAAAFKRQAYTALVQQHCAGAATRVAPIQGATAPAPRVAILKVTPWQQQRRALLASSGINVVTSVGFASSAQAAAARACAQAIASGSSWLVAAGYKGAATTGVQLNGQAVLPGSPPPKPRPPPAKSSPQSPKPSPPTKSSSPPPKSSSPSPKPRAA
ncbi:subtilisin-like serine protease [Chlorella sorokiniana]|uniref:Subtilisin-like serine protease n=1 Tax=Chlorella sorokiniana TaxID=3076 RepID=A0A2P6TED4_CHLSO|nr:subtilisin-like serine protease [Chlorella sorokiniana]|eukprot:PRW20999.1 subtilisin-like serine protease [Chlorella sorokiniana]